jgi:DNA adenine methylase
MFAYIGGKSSHIKWLDPLFPQQFNKFVEVFGGAGWVGIKSQTILQASDRIYNDFNPFIANIHECFRTKNVELLNKLESYPKSDTALYKQFQKEIFGTQHQVVLGDVQLAAKYLYLQTQIFSGTTLGLENACYFCDTASNGKYSSKYDALKNKLRNPKFTDRLVQVSTVENMDCIDLIKKHDSPDTFFYVDPPYFKKEYLYTTDFPREKHEELADTLKNAQGKWLLSYYDFSELAEWYPKDQYHWHSQDVFRWSSTRAHKSETYKADSRGTEIAVMNYTPQASASPTVTTKKVRKTATKPVINADLFPDL